MYITGFASQRVRRDITPFLTEVWRQQLRGSCLCDLRNCVSVEPGEINFGHTYSAISMASSGTLTLRSLVLSGVAPVGNGDSFTTVEHTLALNPTISVAPNAVVSHPRPIGFSLLLISRRAWPLCPVAPFSPHVQEAKACA
jgi:hypothetical protein